MRLSLNVRMVSYIRPIRSVKREILAPQPSLSPGTETQRTRRILFFEEKLEIGSSILIVF